jgi:hypothetical protein
MSRSTPPTFEVGPRHELVTIDTLPPADGTHWRPRRKAQVVAAVQAGMITVDEVCERYRMSLEEFRGWQRALNAEGLQGLKVDRIGRAAGGREAWKQAPDEPWLDRTAKPWER